MSFFLVLNTKEDMLVIKELMAAIDLGKNAMEVNGCCKIYDQLVMKTYVLMGNTLLEGVCLRLT